MFVLLLMLSAAPTCVQSCRAQVRADIQRCHREHRKTPLRPEDDRGGATPHLTCVEAAEFDGGACESACSTKGDGDV